MTILLALHALMLARGAWVHSPTLNEPGHLIAGIANWQFGRFDVYKVNPPLVRLIAAIPVLFVGASTDWHRFSDHPGSRMESLLGEDFVAANGKRSFELFVLARLACIPFSMLGGLYSFIWGRALYGPAGGSLSLILWCCCPNVLGHGQLITSDIAAASMALVTCYSFWKWLQMPSWGRTIVGGLTLGLAELAKYTLVLFLPLWFCMWIVYRWPNRRSMTRRDWAREVGMLTARICLAMCTINVGYAFEDTGMPLGKFKFFSAALGAEGKATAAPSGGGNKFSETWLAALPMPLPKNYLEGIDLQKLDFEKYHEPSYLRGELSDQGWWYYYLYALAVKVPIGTGILFVMAMSVGWWGEPPHRWRDEFILLCPALVIVTFVSMQTGFNEHMRYVLPAVPFVFVWIGRLMYSMGGKHRVYTGIATIGLGWSIVSSLLCYPHNLSYFNELAGGPEGGSYHLIHSNIDWGQDLLILKNWLESNPEVKPINLIYFGNFNPVHAGIEYQVPNELLFSKTTPIPISTLPPGWYAISVNYLRGFPFSIYTGEGQKIKLGQNSLTSFQQLKPVARAGYSIYIYHVPDQPE